MSKGISMNKHLALYQEKIDELKKSNNFREFFSIKHSKNYIVKDNQAMLNLASNDYLGLAIDEALRQEFLDTHERFLAMGASSSRLLTANFECYEQLEQTLGHYFGRSALVFNSGYHMNIGILPAVSDGKTIILADKLIHASMIDGILLSRSKFVRYAHQDFVQLEQLLTRYQEDDNYNKIIVVSESIFSMDGDETDLVALVKLKAKFNKVLLYIDEAHAVGVRGKQGLGCSEEQGVVKDIDFLVGTFGKACASMGGYIICHQIIREYLINFMRPLIFSTAIAPINIAWTNFIFKKIINDSAIQHKRYELNKMAQSFIKKIHRMGYDCPSSSHIVPIILGENKKAMDCAKQLQQSGYYVMAVRHPTVAKDQARLRICLNATINEEQLQDLSYQLQSWNQS